MAFGKLRARRSLRQSHTEGKRRYIRRESGKKGGGREEVERGGQGGEVKCKGLKEKDLPGIIGSSEDFFVDPTLDLTQDLIDRGECETE